MPEENTDAGTAEGTTDETSASGTTPAEGQSDSGEALGDAGKAALASERDARKAAEKSAKESAAKLAEHEAEIARLRRSNAAVKDVDIDGIKAELTAEWAGKLAESAIRAEAKGRLADPADALLYIKAADYATGDDAAITAAVDELLKSKPYLAAAAGAPMWGSVSGGSREASEPEPASPEDRMRRAYGNKT